MEDFNDKIDYMVYRCLSFLFFFHFSIKLNAEINLINVDFNFNPVVVILQNNKSDDQIDLLVKLSLEKPDYFFDEKCLELLKKMVLVEYQTTNSDKLVALINNLLLKKALSDASRGNLYNLLAQLYFLKSDYSKVISLEKKAIFFYKKGEIRKNLQNAYHILATSYIGTGEYYKALELYFDILSKRYGRLSNFRKGAIYHNIAVVYHETHEYKLARFYANTSIIYSADKDVKLPSLLLLSELSIEQKNLKEARFFLKEASNELDYGHDFGYYVMYYERLARLETESSDFAKAQFCFKVANGYVNHIQDRRIIVSLKKNHGMLYEKMLKYDLAIKMYKEALVISRSNNYSYLNSQLTFLLSRVYSKNKQFEEAYTYSEMSKKMSNCVFSVQNNRKIYLVEKKASDADKLKKINILMMGKIIKKNQLKNSRIYNIILFIALFVGIIVIVIILIHYKSVVRHNLTRIKLIEDQKKIVELKSMLKGQETEKDRISKELHDGVANSLISLSHTVPKETRSELLKIYNEIRAISHELNSPFFSSSFDLKKLLEDLVYSLLESANLHVLYLWFPKDSKLALSKESQISIYRIIQEIFVNILKHSKATKVELQVVIDQIQVEVRISDNGVGFDKESVKGGSGLNNLNMRASLLNAHFKIDSVLNVGTTVDLIIPLSNN
jgi:two-component system NarL family sensor kinase